MNKQQFWDLWMPAAGAQGLSFARGRLDTTDTQIVNAALEKLNVVVRDDEGVLLAKGANLRRTADTPMARLHCQGNKITREDIWPTDADYVTPVIVAGSDVGILQHWWNDAGQHSPRAATRRP